jgi:hypothetical protein
LRFWDAATGAAIGEPMRHEGKVKGAVYSPDGKRILSWSDDKTLRFWDAVTGAAIGEPMRLRLVTPGEGEEKDGRARSIIPNDPQQREMVLFFSSPKNRLLVTSFSALQGAMVEVAHEALIQRWPRLRDWVNENRKQLRVKSIILRAMTEWQENGRDERFLLDPGIQLQRGRALLEEPGDVPVEDIRYFVDRSIEKEQGRVAEHKADLADQIARAKRLTKQDAEREATAREAAERGLKRLNSQRTGTKKRWYVSYAWADQSDPKREKKVDAFSEAAKTRGIEVVRDKTTLVHGELITNFMQKIGEDDRIYIFLSDKYMRSPYCMFELFEIWRNNRENKADFLRKVRIFTTDDAKISSPVDWLQYTRYWLQQRDKLQHAIDQVGWADAGEDARAQYRNIEAFAGSVSDVLALFADVVKPRTFEEFERVGLDDLPEN